MNRVPCPIALVVCALMLAGPAATVLGYPATEVDDSFVAPAPPQYNTIEAAVANTDSGGTVTVHAGSYTPATAITLSLPITISGPQAGVDPRTAAGLRTAGGAAEAVVDAGANASAFIIAADNVTISGLDIVSSAAAVSTAAAVTTDNSAARANPVVAYNFVRRTGGIAVYGILLNNTTDAGVRYNNVLDFYGFEPGAVGLLFSADAVVERNEVAGAFGADHHNIGVGSGCTNTLIDRNLTGVGTSGAPKYGIVLGYSSASPKPVGATCTNNLVLDFWQAGISMQMSNCYVVGNELTHTHPAGENRAVIYVRDAVCQNITIAYNLIRDVTLDNSSRNAAIRLNNWVSGQSSTITINNNELVNCLADCYGGYVGIAKTDKSEGGLWDIRNNWWGDTSGPSKPLGPDYAVDPLNCCSINRYGVYTDACLPSYSTLVLGAGHALGGHGTQPSYCWVPWAQFRGRRVTVPATGGTRTFDINFPDNDRYTKHQVTLPDLTGEAILTLSSPMLRSTEPDVEEVRNAMEITLSDGVTFASGMATVRIEYNDALVGAGGDVDDMGGTYTEADMRLAVWRPELPGPNKWQEVWPCTVDTVNNYVEGQVSSFSTFGAMTDALSVAKWELYGD